MTKPPFRARQEIVIDAPLATVWEFNQDLGRIADYHPRVSRVSLLSGTGRRGAGVAYMCHLKDGKNTCVERDLEVVPMERIVTALPEDSMGLSKLFPDYIVESTLTPLGAEATRVEFRHYYSTPTLKAWLAHWLAGRKIAREARETLEAMKQAIELGRWGKGA